MSELRHGGPADCLAGGGEAGELARAVDWSKTAIGPVSSWSQALRSAAALVLHNHSGMLLWWGSELVQIYNDAYRPMLGGKHPRAMGQRLRECWKEVSHIVGPMAERPFRGGPASSSDDLPLLVDRKVPREEAHFRIAYSPVPDHTVEETGIGGVLATVTEITAQAYAERQLRTLRELGAQGAAEAQTAESACQNAARVLRENAWDVPFALFYLISSDGKRAQLAANVGCDSRPDAGVAPAEVDLSRDVGSCRWPIRQVALERRSVVERDLTQCASLLARSPWSEPPNSAIVLALASPEGADVYGAVVFGISPHRVLDASYRSFLELASAHIAIAIRNARALQTERAKLRSVFENAPAIIFTLSGPDLRFDFANPHFVQLIGHRQVLGLPIRQAFPEIEGQEHLKRLEGVYRTGTPYFANEARLVFDRESTRRMAERLINLAYLPSRNDAGSIDGVLVFGFDVTDQVLARHAAEEQRRLAEAAQKQAESTARALQQTVRLSEMFAGILGHDLRNPLSAITTSANLLESRADSERIAKPVARIIASADRMDRMISQLLDFTRLRLGEGFTLERTKVDLLHVARLVIEELEPVHEQKLELQVHGTTVGLWDGDRLAQLLSNLAANACQHGTRETPVRIRVDGTKQDIVEVEVTNGGMISAQLLPSLFEPLQRSAESRKPSRRAEGASGLGLGLFITQQIVLAHGGSIEVVSNDVQGTSFIVRLPRHPGPSSARVFAIDGRASTS